MTTTSGDLTQGVVLLAHGSHDQRWREPLERLRDLLQERLGQERPVAISYLQFCEPTLEQALRLCHARGALCVLVVPVFLSGGGHLLRDVPDAVRAAVERVPELSVSTSGALGEESEVMDAMVHACLRLARIDDAP